MDSKVRRVGLPFALAGRVRRRRTARIPTPQRTRRLLDLRGSVLGERDSMKVESLWRDRVMRNHYSSSAT